MRDLEGAQHAAAEQLVGRQPGDVLAVEDDLAAIGRDIAGDQVEQRRFARAVRADQAGDRAARAPAANNCGRPCRPPKLLVTFWTSITASMATPPPPDIPALPAVAGTLRMCRNAGQR